MGGPFGVVGPSGRYAVARFSVGFCWFFVHFQAWAGNLIKRWFSRITFLSSFSAMLGFTRFSNVFRPVCRLALGHADGPGGSPGGFGGVLGGPWLASGGRWGVLGGPGLASGGPGGLSGCPGVAWGGRSACGSWARFSITNCHTPWGVLGGALGSPWGVFGGSRCAQGGPWGALWVLLSHKDVAIATSLCAWTCLGGVLGGPGVVRGGSSGGSGGGRGCAWGVGGKHMLPVWQHVIPTGVSLGFGGVVGGSLGPGVSRGGPGDALGALWGPLGGVLRGSLGFLGGLFSPCEFARGFWGSLSGPWGALGGGRRRLWGSCGVLARGSRTRGFSF